MITDIHTHQIKEFGIKSVILTREELPENTFCSVGFHPWYLDDFEDVILEKAASFPSVLAIGECGLDANTAHKNETAIFERHIHLAEKLQKPLIIHCVKRHNELVTLKKKLKVSIPMIVHGFNNKQTIANSLLENGFYLSFGAALLQEKSNAVAIFSTIPASHIFLETDESPIDIALIYEKAAELRGISIPEMYRLIENNFRAVFGKYTFLKHN